MRGGLLFLAIALGLAAAAFGGFYLYRDKLELRVAAGPDGGKNDALWRGNSGKWPWGRLPRSLPRGYNQCMHKSSVFHCDPEILGGTVVFKGTRVPVQSLFDHLKAGDSIEVFLEGFPSVKRSQVLAVLKEMEIEVLTHA